MEVLVRVPTLRAAAAVENWEPTYTQLRESTQTWFMPVLWIPGRRQQSMWQDTVYHVAVMHPVRPGSVGPAEYSALCGVHMPRYKAETTVEAFNPLGRSRFVNRRRPCLRCLKLRRS